MPPRTKLTKIQLAVVNAIKSGKATDLDALAKAIGVDDRQAASKALGNQVRSGIVAVGKDGAGRWDFASASITKVGESLRAATISDRDVKPENAPQRRKPHPSSRAEHPPAPAPTPQATGYAPGGDKVLVHVDTLRAIQGAAEGLAKLAGDALAGPSLAMALMGLASQLGTAAAREQDADDNRKRGARRSRTKAPSPSPDGEDDEDGSEGSAEPSDAPTTEDGDDAPTGKEAHFEAQAVSGKRLAVFADQHAAARFYRKSPGCKRVVRIADGRVVVER